ncbi:MAG: HEPN domain-containing protein [Promethearchaeota archaeon]
MIRPLFDPEIFLEISQRIQEFNNVNSEGLFRTAIGRSYYAAFLTALKKLRSKGVKINDNSRIHADVRYILIEKFHKSNIASKLENLFKLRVESDYNLHTRIDMKKWQISLRLAQNIINLVNEI